MLTSQPAHLTAGSLDEAAINALKQVLPGPDEKPSYDPDEVEEFTTDVIPLKLFGKKDANEESAYDSDEGGDERGVQCQQG